ncbi:response regulator receiver domain-containing protein [Luteibacter sp. OK325]|uniref:response regulator n=1 Tax=Luteibacter sp. OK325 TaxID=2135670 RepID=UPI000D45721A|nr:response regulator [Luteibacter sp. OK325]PTR30003.1 response regulator receiver domain-containing protein [Luteibacter sp. OK325]
MPDRLFSQLLVADDDPSTREFLRGALAAMGFVVTLAEDGAQALALARARRFDAMLLDCRMPSGGAIDVLAALRGDAAAESRDAVAMATSAEVPAALRQTLADAGFACVIEKPCQIASLAYALGASPDAETDAPLLDDQEALKATGDASVLQALRSLFRDDLTELIRELDSLANAPATLVERMHRLRSACGFCGAMRLAAQAKSLQNHLMETRWASPAALHRFRSELELTLAALA